MALPRRSWRGGAVALLVGILVGCVPSPPPGDALRVMTWNVETPRYSPSEWAPTIARRGPDVVGLQEICAGEAVELAGILRRDHGLAYEAVPGPVRPTPEEDRKPVNAALRRPCRDGAMIQYGLAVLSRLPVVAATTVLFAPDGRDEQRGYQRLALRTPAGAPLAVYHAHVGLAGVQDAQIRELAAVAGSEPGATVVLGDLNVPVDREDVLRPLTDGFAEVDPSGRLPTWGNRTDAPGTPALAKIDYVFHRGLAASSPAEAPWVPSSDHRPLIGTLRPAPG